LQSVFEDLERLLRIFGPQKILVDIQQKKMGKMFVVIELFDQVLGIGKFCQEVFFDICFFQLQNLFEAEIDQANWKKDETQNYSQHR
jgi:hypothetical protein